MSEAGSSLIAWVAAHWVVVPVVGGVVLLLAAVLDWRFLVDPEGPNASGLLNWIHRDLGRGAYRVALGAVAVLLIVSCVAYWILLQHRG